MKTNKYGFFFLVNLAFAFNFFNSQLLAQTKQNSIIKLFCVQSFKEEMLKAKIEYSNEIAHETCDCYYDEFLKTASHQKAKTKCKLYAQDKLQNY